MALVYARREPSRRPAYQLRPIASPPITHRPRMHEAYCERLRMNRCKLATVPPTCASRPGPWLPPSSPVPPPPSASARMASSASPAPHRTGLVGNVQTSGLGCTLTSTNQPLHHKPKQIFSTCRQILSRIDTDIAICHMGIPKSMCSAFRPDISEDNLWRMPSTYVHGGTGEPGKLLSISYDGVAISSKNIS